MLCLTRTWKLYMCRCVFGGHWLAFTLLEVNAACFVMTKWFRDTRHRKCQCCSSYQIALLYFTSFSSLYPWFSVACSRVVSPIQELYPPCPRFQRPACCGLHLTRFSLCFRIELLNLLAFGYGVSWNRYGFSRKCTELLSLLNLVIENWVLYNFAEFAFTCALQSSVSALMHRGGFWAVQYYVRVPSLASMVFMLAKHE